MKSFLCVVVCLVTLSASCSATEICSVTPTLNVRMAVAGRRNATGHWNLSVDALNQEPRTALKNKDPTEMLLDIGLGTETCDKTDTVRLYASVQGSHTAVPKPGQQGPPPGYEMKEGLGHYKIQTTALAWNDARSKCEQEGGHLMIINSNAEAELFKKIFSQRQGIQNTTDSSVAFMGFHDQDNEGQFITVLGTPLASSGYIKWSSGEPTGGKSSSCGAVDGSGNFYDVSCTLRCFFICEYSDY